MMYNFGDRELFVKMYIIHSLGLSVTCDKSMVFSGYSGLLHQYSGVAWVFFLVRQKMLGGVRKLKNKWPIEMHFPEFKWIFYDCNNNRNNTQKTISICVK